MRCPHCSARNPSGAAWCSQCYASLVEDPEPAEPSSPPGPEPAPAGDAAGDGPGDAAGDVGDRSEGAGAEEEAGADGPAVTTAAREGFRRVEDGFEWRCETCATWVPLERMSCHVCGAAFRLAREDESEIVDRDPGTVLLVSAALPGLGHVLLGRRGDGILRAATYLAWLAGGWMLLRSGRGADVPATPAVSLLLGALALWVVSAIDAVRLAQGDRTQILSPRVYLWLVVGVIGLLILGFLPGILQVGRVAV